MSTDVLEQLYISFKPRIINVVVSDARHLTHLENRLEDYGYIISKHVMYAWNRNKARPQITNVVYVFAVKNGKERELSIMLTQLQKHENMELKILG